MPIIFDEVVADVTPPVPTTSGTESQADTGRASPVDPQSLARELHRIAERAERLNAD